MTKKRPRYTDDFRASAVLMHDANPNFVRVAKHLGIPESTLRSWVNRHNGNGKSPSNSDLDAEVYDMKRSDFHVSVKKLLNLHIDEAENTLLDADHHQVIGGIKILFEVDQLLSGGPTENIN